MNDNQLIGLSGYAQTGKDATATLLMDFGFQRIAFADPIREALYTLNPIVSADNKGRVFTMREVVEAEGWEGAKQTPEVRRLLQIFGTEVGREMFGQDVWVTKARNKLLGGKYVVTDVRFASEVVALREVGAMMIMITRPGYGPVNDHISDSGLDWWNFDYVIENDGTLEDLRDKILALIR